MSVYEIEICPMHLYIDKTNQDIEYTLNIIDNVPFIYFKENVSNTIKIILNNIYSTITQIKINSIDVINNNINSLNNKYSYNYLFIPNYYRSILDLEITTEKSTVQNYKLNLIKFPNNIALLDDVIITNVSNISSFETYKFNYNGILNKNVMETFNRNVINLSDNVSNISINIKKTDIFSSVNTIIEYYDGDGKYIIYKDTNELFIPDILTFIKTYDSSNNKIFKTPILNKTHTFFNILPIIGVNTNRKSFIIDIANLDDLDSSDNYNYNSNQNIFDFIPDDAEVRFKKLDSNNKLGIQYEQFQKDVNTYVFDNDEKYQVVNNIINSTSTDPQGDNPGAKEIQVQNVTGSDSLWDDVLTNSITEPNKYFMLVKSYPFKKIQNDYTKEVLNISNISNIKINIKVTSEDKTVINNYVYIINTK